MFDPETITPNRTDLMQTIQRCAEAYHHVMADLPKGSLRWDVAEFQQRAFLAFAAHLPVLCDLASIQTYIACISQGATIGAIDPVDVGRFCHIAQTAISVWKLANLTVPAAQAKEKREQEKARNQTPLPSKGNQVAVGEPSQAPSQPAEAPKKPTPLPPKGNHPEEKTSPPPDLETLYATSKLPDWETQQALFQSLRKRGVEVPTDDELRTEPSAALYFVETERWFRRSSQQAAAASAPSDQPQPAPAPRQKPTQAA